MLSVAPTGVPLYFALIVAYQTVVLLEPGGQVCLGRLGEITRIGRVDGT